MSIPRLRQPKNLQSSKEQKKMKVDLDFIILTLRDQTKLVISADAYHGILTVENEYKCVVCKVKMDLDSSMKELHKKSNKHLGKINEYPFLETFSENLVRQISKDQYYCTFCNVMMTASLLQRHIASEIHRQEREKAAIRALNYGPSQ